MTDTNRYGPTAARKQGKPGREGRPKSTTIDIHSHVGVPAAAHIAQPHLDLADDVVIVNTGAVVFNGTAAETRTNDRVIAQHLGVF